MACHACSSVQRVKLPLCALSRHRSSPRPPCHQLHVFSQLCSMASDTISIPTSSTAGHVRKQGSTAMARAGDRCIGVCCFSRPPSAFAMRHSGIFSLSTPTSFVAQSISKAHPHVQAAAAGRGFCGPVLLPRCRLRSKAYGSSYTSTGTSLQCCLGFQASGEQAEGGTLQKKAGMLMTFRVFRFSSYLVAALSKALSHHHEVSCATPPAAASVQARSPCRKPKAGDHRGQGA